MQLRLLPSVLVTLEEQVGSELRARKRMKIRGMDRASTEIRIRDRARRLGTSTDKDQG